MTIKSKAKAIVAARRKLHKKLGIKVKNSERGLKISNSKFHK